MKRILTIIAIAFALNGCTSFLNVETLGKSTIEGFFEDIDGMKAAGLGLHRYLLEFYDDNYIRAGELQGDNVNLIRVNADISVQKLFDFNTLAEDNTSGYSYSLWKKAYELCTNANNMIYYGGELLDKFPQYKDVIDENVGYAYFVRALAIFDLCNVFAQPYDFTSDASHPGVVAIDYIPGFDDEISRNTVKECYDLIISDLNKSLECFGSDELKDPTYISGLACKALLAKVYLYMKDYKKASEYAKAVMDKVPLASRSVYVNMFRKAQDNPGEAILRMNAYDSGTGMRSLCNPISSQKMTPSPEFVSKFDNGDIRKELFTFVAEKEDGDEYEGKVYDAVAKYLPIKSGVTTEENRRCDPFILRASEMYLIHAEAECLGGGNLEAAADDIKALRARALGLKASDIRIAYTGKDDLDRIIQEERSKELCFEGNRFFDLKRRGEDIVRSASSTSTTKLVKYPSYLYALPICQLEMEANDYMIQNDGYDGRKSLGE